VVTPFGVVRYASAHVKLVLGKDSAELRVATGSARVFGKVLPGDAGAVPAADEDGWTSLAGPLNVTLRASGDAKSVVDACVSAAKEASALAAQVVKPDAALGTLAAAHVRARQRARARCALARVVAEVQAGARRRGAPRTRRRGRRTVADRALRGRAMVASPHMAPLGPGPRCALAASLAARVPRVRGGGPRRRATGDARAAAPLGNRRGDERGGRVRQGRSVRPARVGGLPADVEARRDPARDEPRAARALHRRVHRRVGERRGLQPVAEHPERRRRHRPLPRPRAGLPPADHRGRLAEPVRFGRFLAEPAALAGSHRGAALRRTLQEPHAQRHRLAQRGRRLDAAQSAARSLEAHLARRRSRALRRGRAASRVQRGRADGHAAVPGPRRPDEEPRPPA
jgi:hypothetical protein